MQIQKERSADKTSTHLKEQLLYNLRPPNDDAKSN